MPWCTALRVIVAAYLDLNAVFAALHVESGDISNAALSMRNGERYYRFAQPT